MVTDTENIRKLAEDLEKQELDVSSDIYNRTAVGHTDFIGVMNMTCCFRLLVAFQHRKCMLSFLPYIYTKTTCTYNM